MNENPAGHTSTPASKRTQEDKLCDYKTLPAVSCNIIHFLNMIYRQVSFNRGLFPSHYLQCPGPVYGQKTHLKMYHEVSIRQDTTRRRPPPHHQHPLADTSLISQRRSPQTALFITPSGAVKKRRLLAESRTVSPFTFMTIRIVNPTFHLQFIWAVIHKWAFLFYSGKAHTRDVHKILCGGTELKWSTLHKKLFCMCLSID